MLSDLRPEGGQNSGDSVFHGIPAGKDEGALFAAFLAGQDFSANSRRAFTQDIRKLARWFSTANREPFTVSRVTTRDVSDFRDHLRREQGQAVATVNRALVTVRRFFAWLTDQGHVASNPAKRVRELRRQALSPKGLDRSQVRMYCPRLLVQFSSGFLPAIRPSCSCRAGFRLPCTNSLR
jgi:site-specific recombinase XerC